MTFEEPTTPISRFLVDTFGDGLRGFADDLAKIGLRVVVLFDELLVPKRFLDRVEVCALHVLDNRKF